MGKRNSDKLITYMQGGIYAIVCVR